MQEEAPLLGDATATSLNFALLPLGPDLGHVSLF